MTDIKFVKGYATFDHIASQIDLAEVVDDYSYHIGTNIGVLLININEYTINGITFSTSTEAVNYILNN